MPPIISIITVTYNPGVSRLQKTLESVQKQNARSDIEYGIVDGGSTDGTLDFLAFHEKSLNFFISEKDKGIYDAMNKGVKKASGEWILFLNAGDYLYTTSIIQDIGEILIRNNPDILYGDCIQEYQSYWVYDKASPLEKLPYQMIASHQSIVCKRSLLQDYPFDLSYKVCADFDFTCHMYKRGASFLYYPSPISVIEPVGFSSNHYKKNLEEKRKITSQYFPEKKIQLYLFYTKKLWLLPFITFIKKIIPQKILYIIHSRKYQHATKK